MNRLYRSDCKIVAEQLKREGVQVDLIYLDPPFNSNRTYSMIFNNRGVTAQQKAYHDMWDFTDRTRQLVLDFREELSDWDLPLAFKDFMRAWLDILESGDADDRRLLNYLMYMTQRLIRLRDILKPTGSIYLHCDPTASHYLKVIMDGIFGRRNFRNEIVWHYRTSSGRPTRHFIRNHDTILFYGKSKQNVFNVQREPWPESTLRKWQHDEHGIYRMNCGKKYYINPDGKMMDNVWDITFSSRSQERRGYTTQKPVDLLKRILQTSSNPNDLVLDPFCGCGTSLEAAERLGRRWIGVDISGDAIDEIKDRMAEIGVYDGQHYDIREGSPDTVAEYNRLNPFEKQDWLIRRLGGLPNPRKSGDMGIDGDMTFHLGGADAESDKWGRLIFSVKTGKQRKPEHVRELIGTMRSEKAQMGILILDADPTPGMESAAQRAGRFDYQLRSDFPPKTYHKVQIFTAYEIIDGATLDCPPSIHDVRQYRKLQMRMQI